MNHRLTQVNNHFSSTRMPMWTLRTFVPFDFTPSDLGGSLRGQTIFITGASRGIGLEIAKRCAKDGANIAIAAKTVTENPKLPGTIYTAAKEIEEAGGRALAIQCDIRDAESVKAAIDKTVETFGGLDILINNASAINPTGVEDMEIKRFDLIQSINSRGTFVSSKFAIPHLRKSKNPHILTISPPLYMGNDQVNWFAKMGTGYVLGKYAMTLITHGLAGELKEDGIACNTLWPRTAIQTAAVQNLLGGDSTMAGSRTAAIMADSAHVILTSKSTATTDNFFLDDEVLISSGKTVTDLKQYLPSPNAADHTLVPDFMC